MYVRDHQRPAFHKALGVDPDWYAHEVFTKTSKLSEQIFPLTLDIDHPRWQRELEALQKANVDLADAVQGKRVFKKIASQLRAGRAFLSLLLIPSKANTVPENTRLEPVY
jgi:magnesium-protoporphyrin IX monomethyl ester (oxidative) cyclase